MGPPSSGSRCPFGEGETKRLASTGVKNNARTSDVRRATAIVSASERKKTPVTPVRSDSGRNTTTGVIVEPTIDRKSTRLNSSHLVISYAVFCLKKKKSAEILHA